MRPRLRDCYDPVSKLALEQFERSLNIVLPLDYFQFLLDSNGGVFHDVVMSKDDVQVEELYGVDTKWEWSDIATIMGVLETVPPGHLTIGRTFTGEEIVMDVSAHDRRGARVGVSEEAIFDDDEDFRVSPLAPTFTDFLAELVATPPEDPAIPCSSEADGELFRLVREDAFDILRRQLSEQSIDKVRDTSGATLFMRAAYFSRVEGLSVLVECGTDVNAKDENGDSALAYAIATGGVDCIRELVRLGVNVEQRNVHGYTPVMRAIGASQVRAALTLMELGADTNVRLPNGTGCRELCSNVLTWKYVLPRL